MARKFFAPPPFFLIKDYFNRYNYFRAKKIRKEKTFAGSLKIERKKILRYLYSCLYE